MDNLWKFKLLKSVQLKSALPLWIHTPIPTSTNRQHKSRKPFTQSIWRHSMVFTDSHIRWVENEEQRTEFNDFNTPKSRWTAYTGLLKRHSVTPSPWCPAASLPGLPFPAHSFSPSYSHPPSSSGHAGQTSQITAHTKYRLAIRPLFHVLYSYNPRVTLQGKQLLKRNPGASWCFVCLYVFTSLHT